MSNVNSDVNYKLVQLKNSQLDQEASFSPTVKCVSS